MAGQTTPRKTTSGRIFAILGVLLLIGSLAPMPWLAEEAEAQGSTGPLKVTRDDYRSQVTEIRGVDAFAYVVLEDDSRDPTYDTRGVVNMTASAEVDGDTYEVWFILLETGIGTGRYVGGFGFTDEVADRVDATYDDLFKQFGVVNPPGGHTTGTGNAALPVEDGATVTVKTESTPTRTTTFEWFETQNAERLRVFVDGAFTPFIDCNLNGLCPSPGQMEGYGVLDIEITDGGLDRDSTKREVYPNLLRVFSSSNPTGVRVEIEEVSTNNARFTGELTLTDSSNAGSGELFVQDGDRLFFEYFEPHRVDGEFKFHVQPGGGVDFVADPGVSISSNLNSYRGLTNPGNKHGSDRAIIEVTLLDQDDKNSVFEETVPLTVDGAGGFEARQVGPRSNLYVATLGFSNDCSNFDMPGVQCVGVGGNRKDISVAVVGEAASKTFTWRAVMDATFTFEDSEGGPFEPPFIGGQDYRICMKDPDSRGQSSALVRAKTSSSTTSGLAVSLSPSGPVNCPGADFDGVFTFNDVSVADGDLVIFEYDDPFVERDGSNQIVRSPFMHWWQTGEPQDPIAPEGREHAAEAERDIVSVQFVTVDSDPPSPPPEPIPESFTEVDRVNEGTEVHLRLEFENDNSKSLPVTGAADVTLRTELCGTEDLTVVVFEESEGSRFYSGVINFTPGGDCESPGGFNVVPVTPGMGLGPAGSNQNVKIFDLVRAFETEEGDLEPAALLGWSPVDNAEISVADGFGNGAFSASLFDRDVLPHFVFAEEVTLEEDRWYNFTFVGGTEWVIVDRSESFTYSGSGPTSRQVDANTPQPIVGGDFRLPHCDFVSISYVISGPLGSSGNLNCQGINGRIVSFSAPPSCPAIGATCTVTIEYKYRAQPVAQGSGWACDDGNQFRYFRTTDGIVFCQDQSNNIVIDYVGGERAITGIGPGGEEEDSTLTFDGFDGTPGVPIFRGDVSVWFDTGNSPLDVTFTYLDPAEDFDGGPGSDDPDHFRSTFARSTWRPSETGEIRIIKDDFSGPATGTVIGPVIPVEVVDMDASHPVRRDTVTVTATGSQAGEECEAILVETGANTRIFRGVVDIQSCINGAEPHTIKIVYQDMHGSDGEEQSIEKTVTNRASENGIVAVCRTADCPGNPNTLPPGEGFFGTGDKSFIYVKDRDRTTESSLKVRVVSDSQPLGEQITLSRVGTGLNAFFLSSEVRFETTNNPGNGRLYVQDGDEWWVEYKDSMDEDGNVGTFPNPLEKFKWNQVNDGTVSFDRGFHIGTKPGDTDGAGSGLERLSRGVVRINDPDLGSDSKTIDILTVETDGNIKDSSDEVVGKLIFNEPLDQDLMLFETGHNTGTFIGMFSFGNSCGSNPFPCVSNPGNGGELKVTYEDDLATSVGHEDTATTKWFEEGFGVVTFDRGGYTVDRSPVITVYDSDLGTQNTIPVTVISQSDGSGISVNLGIRDDVKDDDPRDGIYRGSINLRTSTSSGSSLQVNADNDEIEARYQDSSPPGTRTAKALIGIGAEPVTTLVTNPSSPNGENDWFVSQVTVTFEANVPVEDTFFRKDGGTVQTFSNPITLGEGIHEFQFWSVDPFEGFEEGAKTRTIKVSLTDPTQVVEIEDATSRPGGQVELEWEAVSGKTDPLRFGAYRIYRGAEGASFSAAQHVGNATGESFTDLPPAGDDPPQLGETFTYYVRVANEAGRLGPVSDAIDALSDRVAPRVASFELDKTELREDLGEDTVSATLTVEDDAENLEDIDRVFIRIINPFGSTEAEVNMTGSATTFSGSYTEFDTCGLYNVMGIAADAVGNEGVLNQTVRFIGVDRDPPRLRDVPTQIQQGQDLNVTVVDNCAGVAAISYSINGGTSRDVNVPVRQPGDNCTPGPCEVFFQISADRLQPGENQIRFVLTDANETANVATVTHIVTMVIPDLPDDEDLLQAPSIGAEHSRLVEFGGRFTFSVGGGSPSSVTFATNSVDLGNVIGGLNRDTGRVRVDVSDLEPGQHSATVRVENVFGSDQATFSFYVLEQGVPLPPVNVRVTTDADGRPVISWDANPESQVAVGGYIVHRQTNPWNVIGVTDASTFSYTDITARGGQSYQYAVTSYGTNGEGRMNVGDDSSGLPWFQGVGTTAFETEQISDGGIPPIVFWVILVVLAVLVVVGLLYVNRRQIFGTKEEELYTEEYPDEAETAFGEQRHFIRCPNCSEDFHVNGERPVITECPNCGRKGILR